MLIPNLYSVIKVDKIDDSNYKIQIELDSTHAIFQGHFPANPIMPGVCMMQIIKELTEKIVSKKLTLSKVNNVKFVAKVNPFTDPILDLELNILIDNESIKVKNTTFFKSTNALKFSGVFKS